MDESHQLQQLIDQHYARIHRASLGLCGDRWEADEIAQETFLVAIKSISRFRGEASESTWLYGICLRIHRSRFRSGSRAMRRAARWLMRRRSSDQQADDNSPDRILQRTEQDQQLWQLVQRLPTAQRETIVLRFVESLTVAEIAGTLGCAEGTVKSRLHHATQKLRDWLEQDENTAPETKPTHTALSSMQVLRK